MSGKTFYTKKLGKSVAQSAHPSPIMKFHVIASQSKWKVVSEGSVKALKAFSTVEQAVDFAKDIALKKTGEVVIHEASGSIKHRITYKVVQ